jgi:SH3-like domain-containing protein
MKTHKGDVVIQRLDEWRFAVAVDGLVRYVGSQVECERRAAIFVPKNDRAAQDQALLRLAYLSR